MGLFSRKKTSDSGSDRDADSTAQPGEADGSARAADRSDVGGDVRGPHDSSAVTDSSGHLKLGSIWLKGVEGMELRLELNEAEQTITGVTAVLDDSAVQLQAFAAPRTEGVWVDIRNEIAASIVESGGTAEVITGVFGEELITRMPQRGPDGRTVFVPARFVGVDGPRWFLRAVVSGRAVVEPAAAAPMNELIGSVVIDRGDEAMTQRELLPLSLPHDPSPAPDAEAEASGTPGDADTDAAESGDSGDTAPRFDDLKPFERGPEITEVR